MENETVTHSWGFAVGSKSSIAVIVEISTIQGKILLANLKKSQQKSTFFLFGGERRKNWLNAMTYFPVPLQNF